MKTKIIDKPLKGKVCMVTGGTAGIGKVTARELAKKGARVVITGRNEVKADAVTRWIIQESGNEEVHYYLADFSDLEQVRKLVSDFKDDNPRLDVLVNNAGGFYNRHQKTEYGVEMSFLVNHLAPFLLTNLLMDVIKNSETARIVNISSDAHKQGRIDFEDLAFDRNYLGIKAYGRSKLANILFTYELAERLENSGVSVNALHPGHVATDIWKNDFGYLGPVLKWIVQKFALSPTEGAENSIYLSSAEEVEGVTGKYFVGRSPVKSSKISYDQELAKKLWVLSSKLVGLEGDILLNS